MFTLETEIHIDAPAQTVWSILDDIASYPEWNPLIPEISGRTTVGETLKIRLVQPGLPDLHLTPHLVRIVGARELRWLTALPDPTQLSGDHVFILTPTEEGSCHLRHDETFTGTLVESMWPAIDTVARDAYNAMNKALKQRAEHFYADNVSLHPAVDSGVFASVPASEHNLLRCRCANAPVEVTISEVARHNHLCGCSKCWKPAGALFAQIAVAPANSAKVTANEDKLRVVDPMQAIQRYACRDCGVHMLGTVENRDHHFYGLVFLHPELAVGDAALMPEFAAFVSSLVETGTSPSLTAAIRQRLGRLHISCYDGFSPELMDIIAWHRRKILAGPVA